MARSGSGPARCFPVFPKVDVRFRGRGLMAPPGLSVLGAKGSVRDRLTPPGRVEGSALGRYEVPFHWGGTAPLAPFFIPPLAAKTIQPPCGLRKCIPPLVAGAITLSAGKRVTGFSVAYGSLRIQFPCHPVGSMSLDSRAAGLPYESSSFATPAVRWGGKRKAP